MTGNNFFTDLHGNNCTDHEHTSKSTAQIDGRLLEDKLIFSDKTVF